MLLCRKTYGFRQMLVGAQLFCEILPAIAGENPLAGQYTETTPPPPYPPAAMKAHEQGDIRLRITLEKGKVIDVATVSGPPALALPAARCIKANWKLRPDITGVYDWATKFYFNNPVIDAEALVRIIVKDGRMIEVAPVGGSPKAAAAGVDLVKNMGIFTEPKFDRSIAYQSPAGEVGA